MHFINAVALMNLSFLMALKVLSEECLLNVQN